MAKRWVAILILIAVVPGCYDARVPGIGVSGRVTYRGKPVPRGLIGFQADFYSGGRSALGEIHDGWYSIPSGEGPTEGTFQVIISGLPADPVTGASAIEIPDRYNRRTELNLRMRGRRPVELMFDLD